jgi:hypothetical protein
VAEVPAEAVRLAMTARSHALIDRPDPMVLSDETLTRMMLEAAAPILAEAVAKRILAHMDQSSRRRSVRNRRGLLAYRRHLATAARIAAGAFTTEDELKRIAAEALRRGDFTVCRNDGQGEGKR